MIRYFLHFSASGLFWVAFASQALEGFLVASANVMFRLPKARTEESWLPQNEISIVRFSARQPRLVESDDGATAF